MIKRLTENMNNVISEKYKLTPKLKKNPLNVNVSEQN